MKGKAEPAGDEISAKVAAKWLAADASMQLIDVRSVEEHRDAHLKGSKLMPLPTLPARIQDLDGKRPMLLYCAAGGRSASALRFLQGQGFDRAKHIVGGIQAWHEAGLPLEA